jgi:predicted Zn finger-like uncharacterized protein
MEDASAAAYSGEPAGWNCPGCGTRVAGDPVAADDGTVHCPACGQMFAAASDETAAFPTPPDAADTDPDALHDAYPVTPADRAGDIAEELDGLRIRQVTTLRRGTSRARSYAVIGAIVCLVASVKLVLMTIDYVRAGGWGLTPVGYLLFVGVLLMLAGYFGGRALELHRELQTPPPLPPVEGEPDFSTLSDGSQHWKNLDDIQ